MENLIFCLNATVPIFILMILGMVFKHIGLFDDNFVRRMNSFVFKVTLPVLLFSDLCNEDFFSVWDTKYVVFCFVATFISIAIATLLSFILKDKSKQGEFIQASYRSSAALLGISIVQNIYGNAGMTPLMIIGTVPLYNVMAVVVLAVFKAERQHLDRELVNKTLKGIVTNPIIIGIFVGLVWSVFKLPVPTIFDKTIKSISNLATPMGLMAMGASFDIKKAFKSARAACVCTFIKLCGFAALFLPIAIYLGFTNDKLLAILIMLGSPTTVSSFVMAKSMGHEGTLSSSTVMLTTFFSAFTLTGWLYLLRGLALI